MNTSTRLYGWIKLLTVLHVGEQVMFGMQDVRALKRMLAAYDGCFRNAGNAAAVLLPTGVGLAMLTIHCILKGGRARFIALFVLGLPAIGELHHLVETANAGHYTSGTVTAVPSVVCGMLFLRALVEENRGKKTVKAPAPLQPAVAVRIARDSVGATLTRTRIPVAALHLGTLPQSHYRNPVCKL